MMRLLRKEPKLVVTDYTSDSSPDSRKLQPGEIVFLTYLVNDYFTVECDEGREDLSTRLVHIKRVGQAPPGRNPAYKKDRDDIQRRLLVPLESVEAGDKQEVRERDKHGLGVEYATTTFRNTFTREQQFANPCPLTPVSSMGIYSTNGRLYWVYRDAVYSTTVNLKPDEVRALITEEEDRLNAKVARTLERAQRRERGEIGGRQPIPDDVKMFVWQRDGGSCVKCGSNENLEFDHIIPVVMGGANTSRNLQLLCEPCNRSKGGNLV